MGRPRPRPVAEASTLADELETVAPWLEQLEAFDAVRHILTFVIRWAKEIEQLRTEAASLHAAISRLKAQRDEWQAAIENAMATVMELERHGVVVKLPPSVTGAR